MKALLNFVRKEVPTLAKFTSTQKVISFKSFDKLDGDTYIVQEFAWPVLVLECQASKVADRKLDILEEAILELLNIPEMSLRKVADYLHIGDEVVSAIVVNSLARKKLIDMQPLSLTELGKEYLAQSKAGLFTEEKVFGNVFVSKIDGEVFPYFYEGKLPWGRYQQDMKYLSFNDENQQDFLANRNALVERVNKAFHQYGLIYRHSDDLFAETLDKNTIQFIDEELTDEDFDAQEPVTLADVEVSLNLKNARIKLLKTKAQEAYILFRVVVAKGAPEKYIVESPFTMNMTKWYVDCFNRMIKNNEAIYVGDDQVELLANFCQKISDQFYVEFPELLDNNPEQAIKMMYPLMPTCSISRVLMKQYKEVVNYQNLYSNHSIKARTVITEEAIAIELLLNNYIKNKTDIAKTINKYESVINYKPDLLNLFSFFGLEYDPATKDNCTALHMELSKACKNGVLSHNYSLINSYSFSSGRYGKSCMEKYFFMIVSAYFDEKSKFRQLMIDEGAEFVKKIDFINTKRNKHGAHNDGTVPVEISRDDYETYQNYFADVTNILLKYYD